MQKLTISFFTFLMVLSAAAQRMTPQEYIDHYKPVAIAEMKRSGVPAAIILAQGILESDCGNSDLVQRSNNHFGIKCKSNWTGPSVSHDDDARGECFRAYEHAEGSYRDHSDFLKFSPRYASLFDLDPHDYAGWAHGLKKAGYATNPQYAHLLIRNIERYNLNQYTIEGMLNGIQDAEYQTLSAASMAPEQVINGDAFPDAAGLISARFNGLKGVKVSAGTSLLMVATKFNVRLSRLLEWNELEHDGLLQESQIIYLEKKRTTGSTGAIRAAHDQSLYQLAQSNGIMASSLAAYNRREKHDLIKAGTTVYLQPLQPALEQAAKVSPTEQLAYHVVEPREGLFAISRKYGVSISQLKAWNNLADEHLQIGQKLIISR